MSGRHETDKSHKSQSRVQYATVPGVAPAWFGVDEGPVSATPQTPEQPCVKGTEINPQPAKRTPTAAC